MSGSSYTGRAVKSHRVCVVVIENSPTLEAHDLKLWHALRALPDSSLDRARAHLAAGLPVRRADLGWHGAGPADDGCLVGVSMSRSALLRSPLRIPGLVRLAAIFDSWSFEESRRHGTVADLRARQLPVAARERLGQLLDLEHRRRHGWPEPATSAADRRAGTAP